MSVPAASLAATRPLGVHRYVVPWGWLADEPFESAIDASCQLESHDYVVKRMLSDDPQNFVDFSLREIKRGR